METVADPPLSSVRQPSRGRRRALLALLVLALLAAGILYPPSFHFVLRQGLAFEAWRHGMHLAIGKMRGNIAGSILLSDVRIDHHSPAGTDCVLEIEKVRSTFAWEHLLWHREAGIWKELTLEKVRGSIDLPGVSDMPQAAAALLSPSPTRGERLLLPSALTIKDANVMVRQNHDFIRLEGVDLEASSLEAGHILIRSAFIRQPWLTTAFSNCQGTVALQDSRLVLGNMKVTDALTIASASADLPALLEGRLRMDFTLAAFSGSIQGELKSGAREEHLIFDGDGTFSDISVAQLGAFFRQDADGSIKEGKFTFHGSPRALAKATFTTRFEAANFRWGARRWNSLVAGVTYVDRRLQVPDFELRQSHNLLTLKGETGIPEDWSRWWQTDFSFQIAARLDSLSELSALLGPEFGNIYGKMTVDGSIHGENASFDGQLIASGSHLSFRTAPLDEFQAAIKLQGNEIQVTNAEFIHGDDFLRAHGVVNILGEKRYWGEVHAAVADLSLYSAFLQPPIAPEAFGGGLTLNWSGDGTAAAHSGAFRLTLNRIRPLGTADAATWNPIDLTAEATYSPQSIFFSNLVLGNGAASLSGRVVATPASLTLQDLKLQHGKATWLSGDAQIPLNVWAAWQNPATASWWNDASPCKVALKMDRLSLADALLLTGREQPYQGEITGTLNLDGTLAKLSAGGALVIQNAGGTFLAGTLKGMRASLDFRGAETLVKSAAGSWNGLPWTATGTVATAKARTPSVDVAVQVASAPVTFGAGVSGQMSFDVHAGGPPDALTIGGAAKLLSLQVNDTASMQNILAANGIGLDHPFPPLALPGPASWKLDLDVTGEAPLKLQNAAGRISPSLHAGGTIGQPHLTGSFRIAELALQDEHPVLAEATVFLGPDLARSGVVARISGIPELAAPAAPPRGKGKPPVQAAEAEGYIYGTLGEKHYTWDPDTAPLLEMPSSLAGEAPLPSFGLNMDGFGLGARLPAADPSGIFPAPIPPPAFP